MAELRYYVSFGDGDYSEDMEWQIDLTDEEQDAYDYAVENEIALEDVPELEAALIRAAEEIEEEELRLGISNKLEYILESQGLLEMDADELNDLVANRDPYALAFFKLTDTSEEKLDEWDANNLDELPLVKDFDEDFEPYCPFFVNVHFVDPNEE